jgi:hypothetical protein
MAQAVFETVFEADVWKTFTNLLSASPAPSGGAEALLQQTCRHLAQMYVYLGRDERVFQKINKNNAFCCCCAGPFVNLAS